MKGIGIGLVAEKAPRRAGALCRSASLGCATWASCHRCTCIRAGPWDCLQTARGRCVRAVRRLRRPFAG